MCAFILEDLTDANRVAMISPQNEFVTVEKQEYDLALKTGYRPASEQELSKGTEQALYSTDKYRALAGLAGVARGLTVGLSDVAMTKTDWVDPETLRKMQEYAPEESIGGEVIGTVGGFLIPGGQLAAAGKAVKAGNLARGTARAGLGLIDLAGTPVRGLAAAGRAVEKGVAKGLASMGRMVKPSAEAMERSKVLEAIVKHATSQRFLPGSVMAAIPRIVGQGVEGALYGAGRYLSEESLGNAEANAETMLSFVGTGALLGAALPAGWSIGRPYASKIIRKSAETGRKVASLILPMVGKSVIGYTGQVLGAIGGGYIGGKVGSPTGNAGGILLGALIGEGVAESLAMKQAIGRAGGILGEGIGGAGGTYFGIKAGLGHKEASKEVFERIGSAVGDITDSAIASSLGAGGGTVAGAASVAGGGKKLGQMIGGTIDNLTSTTTFRKVVDGAVTQPYAAVSSLVSDMPMGDIAQAVRKPFSAEGMIARRMATMGDHELKEYSFGVSRAINDHVNAMDDVYNQVSGKLGQAGKDAYRMEDLFIHSSPLEAAQNYSATLFKVSKMVDNLVDSGKLDKEASDKIYKFLIAAQDNWASEMHSVQEIIKEETAKLFRKSKSYQELIEKFGPSYPKEIVRDVGIYFAQTVGMASKLAIGKGAGKLPGPLGKHARNIGYTLTDVQVKRVEEFLKHWVQKAPTSSINRLNKVQDKAIKHRKMFNKFATEVDKKLGGETSFADQVDMAFREHIQTSYGPQAAEFQRFQDITFSYKKAQDRFNLKFAKNGKVNQEAIHDFMKKLGTEEMDTESLNIMQEWLRRSGQMTEMAKDQVSGEISAATSVFKQTIKNMDDLAVRNKLRHHREKSPLLNDLLFMGVAASLGGIPGAAVAGGMRMVANPMLATKALYIMERVATGVRTQIADACEEWLHLPTERTKGFRGIAGTFLGEKKADALYRGVEHLQKGSVGTMPYKVGTRLLFEKFHPEVDPAKQEQGRAEAYKKHLQALAKWQEDPQVLVGHLGQQLQGMEAFAPLHAASMAQKATQALSYLWEQAPKPGGSMNMWNYDWQPNAVEISEYTKTLAIVNDPRVAMQKLKHGTITQKEVETLKTIYPHLYQMMRNEMMTQVAELQTKLPYSKRVMLSTLFDLPVEPTYTQPALLPQEEAQQEEVGQPDEKARKTKPIAMKMYETRASQISQGSPGMKR